MAGDLSLWQPIVINQDGGDDSQYDAYVFAWSRDGIHRDGTIKFYMNGRCTLAEMI